MAAWQDQTNIRDCIRVHTDHRSILVPRYSAAGLQNSLCPRLPFLWTPVRHIAHGPLTNYVVHVYTDGSAMNNDSPAECTSAATWISDTSTSDHQRITSLPSSNNVAEIVAVTMALQAGQLTNLHIHTDSKVTLKLLEGGLLELERDGWINAPWVAFPPRGLPSSMHNILSHLLYQVHAHQGMLSVSWVKAHASHPLNKAADKAAKSALLVDSAIHLPDLQAPPGWTDTAPMLGSQSLASLTRCVVQDSTVPPLSKAKCAQFITRWTTHLHIMTGLTLDAGLFAPRIWKLNIPPPPPGAPMEGCNRLPPDWAHLVWQYGARPHMQLWHGNVTDPHLVKLQVPQPDPPHAGTPEPPPRPARLCPGMEPPLVPLLALKELESPRQVGKAAAKELRRSWPEREWVIGLYLWLLWTNKMWEVHGEGHAPPWKLRNALRATITAVPDLRPIN